MVTLGILGLAQSDFTPTWTGVPKGVPGREVLAYLCAVISLVSGIGLLWQRAAVIASRLLLGSFLVWLLCSGCLSSSALLLPRLLGGRWVTPRCWRPLPLCAQSVGRPAPSAVA